MSKETKLLDKPHKTYYGGKGSDGVYHKIINELPECDLFIELFGGNYTISRKIGDDCDKWINDKDSRLFKKYKSTRHYQLQNYKWSNLAFDLAFSRIYKYAKQYERITLFIDPPYKVSSRQDQRLRYGVEMTDKEHSLLIKLVLKLNRDLPHIKIMVTHNHDTQYSWAFQKWRCMPYPNSIRNGVVEELLFMSFPKTIYLEEFKYTGGDYIKRGIIKKQVDKVVLENLLQDRYIMLNIIKQTLKGIELMESKEEERFYWNIAYEIAEDLRRRLLPHCRKVYIGGSIRRLSQRVKDIELIVLPKDVNTLDLFENVDASRGMRDAGFVKEVRQMGEVTGTIEVAKKLKIKLIQGINVDMFIPSPHDFYRQLAIRTGSDVFVKNKLATAWKRKGWIGAGALGLRRRDECHLVIDKNGKSTVKTVIASKPTLPPVWRSEKEFFEWLGLSWEMYGNPRNRK